jgi:hypothetical protein
VRTEVRPVGCDHVGVLKEAAMLVRLAAVFVVAAVVLGPAMFT